MAFMLALIRAANALNDNTTIFGFPVVPDVNNAKAGAASENRKSDWLRPVVLRGESTIGTGQWSAPVDTMATGSTNRQMLLRSGLLKPGSSIKAQAPDCQIPKSAEKNSADGGNARPTIRPRSEPAVVSAADQFTASDQSLLPPINSCFPGQYTPPSFSDVISIVALLTRV